MNGTLVTSLGPLVAVQPGVTGFGDLYPQAYLKWNQGVHNFTVYGFGDIPVGAYRQCLQPLLTFEQHDAGRGQ